jgi:hypothetical protein
MNAQQQTQQQTQAAAAAATRASVRSAGAIVAARGHSAFLSDAAAGHLVVKMGTQQMVPSKELLVFWATEIFRSPDKRTIYGMRNGEKRCRKSGPDGAEVDPNGSELPYAALVAKNFDLLHDKAADHWQLLFRCLPDSSLEGFDAAACHDRYAHDDVFGAYKPTAEVLKRILAPLEFGPGPNQDLLEPGNEHTANFCAGLSSAQINTWARFVKHAAACHYGTLKSADYTEKLTIKPPGKRDGIVEDADAAPLMIPRKDAEPDWVPLKQQVFDTDVKLALKTVKRKREEEEEEQSPDDMIPGYPHVFLLPTGCDRLTLQLHGLPIESTMVDRDASLITVSAPTVSLKDSAPALMRRADRDRLDKHLTIIPAPGGWTHFTVSVDPCVVNDPKPLALPGQPTQSIKINMGKHPPALHHKRARGEPDFAVEDLDEAPVLGYAGQ